MNSLIRPISPESYFIVDPSIGFGRNEIPIDDNQQRFLPPLRAEYQLGFDDIEEEEDAGDLGPYDVVETPEPADDDEAWSHTNDQYDR